MIALPHYWIFADGSCGAKAACTGAWASLVASRAGVVKVLYGCSRPTTISRCELEPIIAATRFIRSTCGSRNGAGVRVAVYSDSEYTVRALSSDEGMNKNEDLFTAMRAATGALQMRYTWRERNSHPYMALCDALCSAIRRSLIDAMTGIAGGNDIEMFVTPVELPAEDGGEYVEIPS